MDSSTSSYPVSPDTRELPLNTEIARHAYDLWEKYGHPEGRDIEIWLEAERQLLGVDANVNRLAGGAVRSQPLEDALYAPGPTSPPMARPATPSGTPAKRRR
ncbi:MAG TPA: DUF2934 domain-containing protein [Candidatus Didemnitutus sp.]|nr:DUF2934 domain-containing protein [Candidatus Didemnitutus sp.]